MTVRTELARAIVPQGGEDHVVADGGANDARADLGHHAGALVSGDRRWRHGHAGDAAVEGLHVRVAQAGGGHPDTDFSRAWRSDVDLGELDGTVGLQLHGCPGHVCFLSCC
jgi:hypothetical protein